MALSGRYIEKPTHVYTSLPSYSAEEVLQIILGFVEEVHGQFVVVHAIGGPFFQASDDLLRFLEGGRLSKSLGLFYLAKQGFNLFYGNRHIGLPFLSHLGVVVVVAVYADLYVGADHLPPGDVAVAAGNVFVEHEIRSVTAQEGARVDGVGGFMACRAVVRSRWVVMARLAIVRAEDQFAMRLRVGMARTALYLGVYDVGLMVEDRTIEGRGDRFDARMAVGALAWYLH